VFDALTERFHVLGIQAGEPGTVAQTIAGVDIALWDVEARQAGLPLFAHLIQAFGDDIYKAMPVMPCYASGLGPESAEQQAMRARDEGHHAFKLKVGFGDEEDPANLAAMRRALGNDAIIMLDANQRWTVDEAASKAEILARHVPYWLEEPLPADRPADEWRDLAARCSIPLAGGENLRGPDLEAAAGDGSLRFIQPDIAKWGGFSAGYPMAKAILGSGKTYCPHYLGGGTGLVASAHLLAAAGGPGLLEVDYNPNPLRALMADPLPEISEGRCHLTSRPGLGVEPLLGDLAPYRTL
jgi:L-alanine-DL-glutamate epimerase-like enolase superfamily enzyme